MSISGEGRGPLAQAGETGRSDEANEFFEAVSGVGATTPEAKRYAREFLEDYRGSSSELGPEQGILSQMRESTSKVKDTLRDARKRLSEINKTSPSDKWFRLGAALMSPTQTGSLGESLAKGASAFGEGLSQERAREQELATNIMDLETQIAQADVPVQEAELSLREMLRQQEGRLAEEAMGILGKRTGSSTSDRQTQEQLHYYDQLRRENPDLDPQTAWDRAGNLVHDKRGVEFSEDLGLTRGFDEVTGETWEITPGEDGARSGSAGAPRRRRPGDRSDMSGTTVTTDTGYEVDVRDYYPSEESLSLWGAAQEGTGLWSGVREGLNVGLGWFGLPQWEQTTDARQTLSSEAQEFTRSLAVNDRFPVREQERIREEIAILPEVLSNPSKARNEMRSIDTSLRRRMWQAEADAQDQSLPTDLRESQETNAANIRRFLPILNVPPQERKFRPILDDAVNEIVGMTDSGTIALPDGTEVGEEDIRDRLKHLEDYEVRAFIESIRQMGEDQ